MVRGPFPPMGRTHVQPLLGFSLHPAANNAPARENQGVRDIIIDDGQLKIAA
jgi:hypothetical protein